VKGPVSFDEQRRWTRAILLARLKGFHAWQEGQEEERMRSPPTPVPEVMDVKRLDHLPLIGAILRALAMKDPIDALIPPHKRHAVTVGLT
jgi:hypothetical protein